MLYTAFKKSAFWVTHWQKFHSVAHKSPVRGDRANLSLAKKKPIPLQKVRFFLGIKRRKLADTVVFVRFDNMTQIAFKGPRIMKQINKIAVALSTRGSEVCGSVTQRSASESNQAKTNTPDFNQERGRETGSGSLVLLHQASMYVRVCKVKNNLQSLSVLNVEQFWLTLTTTVSSTQSVSAVCYSLH